MDVDQDFSSPHFRIQQLARGVYAAIHKEGGAAIGNAGIIEMTHSTLIYDTFISPVAADDLRIVAEKITAKPVRTVINSHYHNDHIRGNQAFPGAEIITSGKTLTLIRTAGMEELKRVAREPAAEGADDGD